ncbi:hypothetical protein [Salinarimonas rosea]|uniref:hypothetical protein n=1 Tax=Salinarimonas rosea TaxID=552063 RepID=UPI000424FF31|nr:hypothetical protein [Salinarimonas rosea]
MARETRNSMTLAAAVAAALALGGCAGDLNPVRDVFVAVGAGAAPQQAPTFVEETRAGAPSGYVPVRPTPRRATDPKTPEEVAQARAALEADLEAVAQRGEQARGLAIGPDPAPVVVPPLPPLSEDPAPPPVSR